LSKLNSAKMAMDSQNSMALEMPNLARATTNTLGAGANVLTKQVSSSTYDKESNPNSVYAKKEDEELK
jgi:hypothetical protein